MQKSNSKFKSGLSRKFISEDLDDTKKIARDFIEYLGEDDNLILLQGELGAGKTTFSQAVLEYVGAEGPFTSPTFVIMKDYSVDFKNKNGVEFRRVYHLDCYRIGGDDLKDLGWEEILENKNNLVLLEWPENVQNVLSKKFIKIEFKVLSENKREVRIS